LSDSTDTGLCSRENTAFRARFQRSRGTQALNGRSAPGAATARPAGGEGPTRGDSSTLHSWSIYRIPAGGGEVEEFLDLELAEQLWWLEFSADGEFLIVEPARHQSDVWIPESSDPHLN
jgi:hypothetical protein